MIIVEPIKLGDPPVSGGGGCYYDRNGALQTAPPNTLRVTYDPSDLSKAPFALIEPERKNHIRNNTMQGAKVGVPFVDGALPTGWQLDATSAQKVQIVAVHDSAGINCIDVRFFSASNDRGYLAIYPEPTNGTGITDVAAGQIWAGSIFAEHVAGALPPNNVLYLRAIGPASEVGSWGTFFNPTGAALRHGFVDITTPPLPATSERLTMFYLASGLPIGGAFDFTIRIGLPQAARDWVSKYPIKTSGTIVNRAADVLGAGAGLVFSNVPIVEPAYDAKATYAKDARVYDPVTYELFQSLIAGNVGKALTDTGAWSPRGAINRRAMFDDYNNTQTTMPDEIVVVLSPEMVAQGLYLGNLDVDEVLVSMVDAVDGVVYSETTDLIESNSKSSYFNWMFKRIKRRTYFFTLDLPVYARGLVTVCLRKIGGTAKCGMCVIGPVDEFGPTLLGLSTEGKDFSSTTFNFDGTSKTTIRPYAKRMSCDVVVPNDEITYVQDRLFELRQRALVWVGGPYGATAVFGRYGSFKNVIEYQMQSKMNLTIEGAV